LAVGRARSSYAAARTPEAVTLPEPVTLPVPAPLVPEPGVPLLVPEPGVPLLVPEPGVPLLEPELLPALAPEVSPALVPLTVPVAPLLVPELLPLPATPLARLPHAAMVKSASTGEHRQRVSGGGSNTRGFSHQRDGGARDYINESGLPSASPASRSSARRMSDKAEEK
jgi:hypothetical protein